jgi:hypothetical protein
MQQELVYCDMCDAMFESPPQSTSNYYYCPDCALKKPYTVANIEQELLKLGYTTEQIRHGTPWWDLPRGCCSVSSYLLVIKPMHDTYTYYKQCIQELQKKQQDLSYVLQLPKRPPNTYEISTSHPQTDFDIRMQIRITFQYLQETARKMQAHANTCTVYTDEKAMVIQDKARRLEEQRLQGIVREVVEKA